MLKRAGSSDICYVFHLDDFAHEVTARKGETRNGRIGDSDKSAQKRNASDGAVCSDGAQG